MENISGLEIFFSILILFVPIIAIVKKRFLPYFLPFALASSPYFTAASLLGTFVLNLNLIFKKVPRDISLLLLIWFCYATFSLFFNLNLTSLSELIQLFIAIIFFRYVFNLSSSKLGKESTMKSILFSGILLCLFEISIFSFGISIDTNAFAGITPHNYASFFIVFSTIIIPFYVIRNLSLRYLIILIGFITLVLNAGRAMQIVAIAIIGMQLFFSDKKSLKNFIKSFLLFLFLIAVSLVVDLNQLQEQSFNPNSLFSVINFENNFSNLERLNLLIMSYDLFIERPYGHGIGSSASLFINNLYTEVQHYPHPHNTLAFMAVELGIIGIFIYLYLIFIIFRRYRYLKNIHEKNLLRNSLLCFFCFSVVEPVFYNGLLTIIVAMFLGFILSIGFIRNE